MLGWLSSPRGLGDATYSLLVWLERLNGVGGLGVSPAVFIVPRLCLRCVAASGPCLHVSFVAGRLVLIRFSLPMDLVQRRGTDHKTSLTFPSYKPLSRAHITYDQTVLSQVVCWRSGRN
jgi:hypothetical protein